MAACQATVFLPSSHLRLLSRASKCGNKRRTSRHAARLRLERDSAFFGTTSTKRSVKARVWLGGDQGGHRDFTDDAIAEDFYSVLGLTPDASPVEIKRAYYSCMKTCHPDLSNNDPASTDFCMFVNEIYEVLSDPEQRIVYDEINGFAPTSANPFLTSTQERDHSFVDEFSCIGCKNCALIAPDTFEIEEVFGRARVHCQSGCAPRAQEAIDTCPVDCIHWVTAAQLTLLEDEMRRIERVNVAMMMSGMGCRSPDVFAQASWRWEKRQSQALNRARIRMMKEKGKNAPGAFWQGWTVFGGDDDFRPDGSEARERAAKTAAASRRWREYSRQNASFRRSAGTLPSSKSGAKQKQKTAAKWSFQLPLGAHTTVILHNRHHLSSSSTSQAPAEQFLIDPSRSGLPVPLPGIVLRW